MRTCYHCAQQIRGRCRLIVPPNYIVRLGLDFTRAYHEACYQKVESEAAKELEESYESTV